GRTTKAWTAFSSLQALQQQQALYPTALTSASTSPLPPPLSAADLDRLIDAVLRRATPHASAGLRRLAVEQVFASFDLTPATASSAMTTASVDHLDRPRPSVYALHSLLRARSMAILDDWTQSFADVLDVVRLAASVAVPMDEATVAVHVLRAYAASAGAASTPAEHRDRVLERLGAFVNWVRAGKPTEPGLTWLRADVPGGAFPEPLHQQLFALRELKRPPPLAKDAPPALRRRHRVWTRALKELRAGRYPGAENEIQAACLAAMQGLQKLGDIEGMLAILKNMEDGPGEGAAPWAEGP
ncbi:hypothetical protein HK405_009984, partial [Cladochytrium tenue]